MLQKGITRDGISPELAGEGQRNGRLWVLSHGIQVLRKPILLFQALFSFRGCGRAQLDLSQLLLLPEVLPL